MHADARGCTRMHADARGCTRMHADARGCTRMHADARGSLPAQHKAPLLDSRRGALLVRGTDPRLLFALIRVHPRPTGRVLAALRGGPDEVELGLALERPPRHAVSADDHVLLLR